LQWSHTQISEPAMQSNWIWQVGLVLEVMADMNEVEMIEELEN
jgi:hypothetical protein